MMTSKDLDNFRPSKSKGQNFLISQAVIDRISQLIPECDYCVEIGPGTGNLTQGIESRCSMELFCIEKDKELFKFLTEKRFCNNKKVSVVNQDATDFDYLSIYPNKFDVNIAGNLPYSCATDIIFNIVCCNEKFKNGVFMMQKEAVDNICSSQSTGCQDLTGMFIRSFYNVKKTFDVSKECFKPKPKIASSVFIMDRFLTLSKNDTTQYLNFLSKLFSFRRKTVVNNLRFHFQKTNTQILTEMLANLGYNANIRAMDLSASHTLELFKQVQKL